MSNKKTKQMRKTYRKRIESVADADLRREIFRLAKNRDILGVIAILETVVIITMFVAWKIKAV